MVPTSPHWSRPARVLAAVAVLALGLATLAFVAMAVAPERRGPAIEELTVERAILRPGTIQLELRNTGPDPVKVAQVFVNDSFVNFSGATDSVARLQTSNLRLDYPWQSDLPYTITILSSSGAAFEHHIQAAVLTPEATRSTFAQMVTLGALIGIVPVLLGMTALPMLRRAKPSTVRGLLAVTVGMLGFLAIDAAIDGVELATATKGIFGGASLVPLGATIAFLVLAAIDRVPRRGTNEWRLALLIAVGIGLHNLGEGLAVGSAFAIGELAIGTALFFGFATHNLTEGIAVISPLVGQRTSWLRLAALGVVAGGPAMLGTTLGALATSPEQSAFLLGCGIGAILQVIVQLVPLLRSRTDQGFDLHVVGGLAGGVMAMYLTSLLVVA